MSSKATIPAKNGNGIVKSGEFSYTRTSRTLIAYDRTYDIPVKTVEFSDKLDAAREAIAKTTKSSDTIMAVRKGIALFIGAEEVERIYPETLLQQLDVDEVLGFWTALNFELNRNHNELLARYTAAAVVRK